MRGLALAFAAAALAAPAVAQDASASPAPVAAPKTKRVCKWIETGNPLDNKRICREVAVKEPAAATSVATQPAPEQIAQAQPHY